MIQSLLLSNKLVVHMKIFFRCRANNGRKKPWRLLCMQDVKDGMGVHEASRLYNLPYETLRRRVAENVDLECRPGPPKRGN